VFWRDTAKQYMTYIGYHIAKKGKSEGQRVRTAHYVGKDLREATLNAILIDRRWDHVVAETKRRAKLLEQSLGRSRVFPVWPTEQQQRIRGANYEELQEMGLLLEFPPESGEEMQPFLMITDLKEKFLAAQKRRIGLNGRRGLKPGTYLQMERNLGIALKGIDARSNVLTLTREDYRALVEHWLSPERKITERTAGNYCKAFKRMIDFADAESICGFRKPKIDDLFGFSNARGHIERFEPEQMEKLFSAATERCRMYILLGLNTGYNQIDVANLRKDEIIEINGDVYLARRRAKTSHQNDFRTLHYLWPETWEVLGKHLAPDNAENLALLNVNGKKLKRGKTDNIRDSMNEVRDASGVRNVTYKQLRKFGITAVKRLTMNPEIARMYASHRIHGVLGNYDRDDFFEPLTQALKKWREELLNDGVLQPVRAGEDTANLGGTNDGPILTADTSVCLQLQT
jgi:hypothetical protein